jgi:hypothetical protein
LLDIRSLFDEAARRAQAGEAVLPPPHSPLVPFDKEGAPDLQRELIIRPG